MNTPCCPPAFGTCLIPTRRAWWRRLAEALGRWRRASEATPVALLDAKALRDIGWCCAEPPRAEPPLGYRHLRDFL